MIDNLSIQYVTDQDGNKQAVLIPIKEWQHLQNELKSLREYLQLRDNLSRAFIEMKEIRNGKLPKTSLKSFLDEC